MIIATEVSLFARDLPSGDLIVSLTLSEYLPEHDSQQISLTMYSVPSVWVTLLLQPFYCTIEVQFLNLSEQFAFFKHFLD
jgi:hypothetical protein